MVDVPRHPEPSDAERLHTYLARMTPGGAGGQSRAVGPIVPRDAARAQVVGSGDEDSLDSTASKIDVFAITGTATSTFELTFDPIDDSWNPTLNGVMLDEGTDYSISGQTLTVTTPADLFKGVTTQGSPWELRVQYDYLVGIPTPPIGDIPTDMLLWLLADNNGSTSTNGASVPGNGWADRSGNGNNTTDGGGGTYRAGVTPAGGPAVEMGGLRSNAFDLPNFLTGHAAGEVFFVLKSDLDNAENPGLYQFGTHERSYHPFSDGNIYDNFGTNLRKNAGNPTPALTSWHTWNVTSKSGGWTGRINNSVLFTTATNTVAWSTTPTLLYDANGLYQWDGMVAEVIVYGRELTTDERSAVYSYLTARHGL